MDIKIQKTVSKQYKLTGFEKNIPNNCNDKISGLIIYNLKILRFK